MLGGPDAPSNKPNIAGIRIGGMGGQNLKQCAAENIVALCDVDQSYAAKTFQAYSGPLTEMVLMGNLAVRFPNCQLLWDGPNMRVTNDKDANEYTQRKYREGWAL